MCARRLAVVCRRVPAAVARHASASTAYLYIITECLCARAALQSCVAGCPRRWHVTCPPRQRTCISSLSACVRAPPCSRVSPGARGGGTSRVRLDSVPVYHHRVPVCARRLAVVCRRVPAAVARHASASTAYLYIITECLCARAALQSCVAGCPRRWHVTRPPRQRTCISSLSACVRAPPCSRVSPGARGGGTSRVRLQMRNLMVLLRKCCNHPFLIEHPLDRVTGELCIDTRLVTSSGKMMMLDRMLVELKRRGHKVRGGATG